MMTLTPKSKERLTEKGLLVYGHGDMWLLVKPIGVPGNRIPSMKRSTVATLDGKKKDSVSDCPTLTLVLEEGIYKVGCWDWFPGPGPGDFSLEFEKEEAAIGFVEKYFFDETPYFEARKVYEHNSRDAITIGEIRTIFEQVCATMEAAFPDEEIPISPHFTHKIPLDRWRIEKLKTDKPTLQAELGYLPNALRIIRTKIHEQKPLAFEDVHEVAELMMEMSLRLKAEDEKM